MLQRYGATLVQIEVVLNLLQTFHLAMNATARAWPVVTEEVQERCLTRVVGRARFLERLTAEQQTQPVTDAIAAHTEQPILAVALGGTREMLVVKDDADTNAEGMDGRALVVPWAMSSQGGGSALTARVVAASNAAS